MKVRVLNVFDNTTKKDYVFEVANENEIPFNDYQVNDIDDVDDVDLEMFVEVGALLDYQDEMFDKDLPKITLIEVWRNEGNFGDVEVEKLEDGQDYIETQEIIDNKVVSTYTWEDGEELSDEEYDLIQENYDVYSEPKYFEAFVN